ncbi:FUSC family protein [Flavobacterium johnsoniae]|uniref:Fusaric acid resistance protein-like n=1 Tax=Flavobacterium johnsoniae TaxID=986 RepID=A0A1M5UR43_FLAJO|nr:FUSC family protein [Flavobacterium johnsoniae]SHH65380.1 Fusaric acid resistance protein-like [Flavobacterium johnsoniae]
MKSNIFKDYPDAGIVLKATLLTTVIFISCFLGLGINRMLQLSDDYLSGIWCAVSAIVVFDDLPKNARSLMKDRLLGTFVGALLTTIIIYFTHNLFLSLGISVFFTCILISVFKWTGALKIGCITVIIVGLSTHGKTFDIVWQSGLMRFLESIAGGAVSLVATIVIEKIKK